MAPAGSRATVCTSGARAFLRWRAGVALLICGYTMKRLSSAVTLSLLFTLPTLAQNFTSFEVDPPDPTSKDPVTLIVRYFESCPPPPDVVRDGFNIDITLHGSICLSPPHLLEYHLDVGTLPAGQYRVTVHNLSGKPGIETFTVLDANSSIVIAPSLGATSGGTVVDIAFSGGFCIGREPTTCPLPTITFGGVAATNVAIVDYAHFRAPTPPHAAGPVLLTINGDSLQAHSYAFRYYDPSADP